MDHPSDSGTSRQMFSHADRIGTMPLHAQRHSLDTLDQLEGVEGRQRRAQIAQQDDPGAKNISNGTKRLCRLCPDRTTIGGVRRVEQGLPVREDQPVEIATIDYHPINGRPMTAQIFGRGIDDDSCAMFDTATKQRRRRIIHDKRDTQFATDGGDVRNWEQFRLGGQGLRTKGSDALIRRATEIFRIGLVDEAHLNALILERVRKQIVGAAIKGSRTDDIVARTRQILDRIG